MGFYLEQRTWGCFKGSTWVRVDHRHNHFCITVPEGNPAVAKFGELKVTSLLSRTKGKRNRSDPGDNSPMLYAMKKLHSLRVSYSDVRQLRDSCITILSNLVQENLACDSLFSLPSSSPLTRFFAAWVSKQTGSGRCFPDAIRKAAASDVLSSLASLSISSRDRTALRTEIKRFIHRYSPEEDFQMKAVDVRHIFTLCGKTVEKSLSHGKNRSAHPVRLVKIIACHARVD